MKGVPPLGGGGASESQGGPSPDELAEPLHEWEAGRWAALVTDAPQSLGFAFGASEDVLEQVLCRVRQLAGAAVERVRVGRSGAWSAVVSTLRTLPSGGALVVDLGRAEDEEPWSALDWQGLNLARDSRERTDRHVLFWVRGFDGVEELREGAADLWALRSIVLQFPSMADFDRVKGPEEEAPFETLKRLVDEARTGSLDPRAMGWALGEVGATTGIQSSTLRAAYGRLVVGAGLLSVEDLRTNRLIGVARQLGGLPLLCRVAARIASDPERWPPEPITQRGSLETLGAALHFNLLPEHRSFWLSQVALDCEDRPRTAQRVLAAGRQIVGEATGWATASLQRSRLRPFLALASGHRALRRADSSGRARWAEAIATMLRLEYACLGLLRQAPDRRCGDGWTHLRQAIRFDPSAALRVRSAVDERHTATSIRDPRVAANGGLGAAHALRALATPDDRAAALELLLFTADLPARVPFLATPDELRALSVASEDPIEAALAILRDFVGAPLYQPAPLGLDNVRFDPLADLRVEGWVLAASLLRELGRPVDALVPIERALAHSYLCDVRQIALSELECARIHVALGDADRAVEHLDRVEYVLADEQDDEWDLRPLTTLVSAAVLRARVTRRAEPLSEVADLCTREENRRLLFELELERAGSTWLAESERGAAARRALSMAREAGYLLLEARASAWCAHFGGPDAAALRARADWVAARCTSPELSAALNATLVEEL